MNFRLYGLFIESELSNAVPLALSSTNAALLARMHKSRAAGWNASIRPVGELELTNDEVDKIKKAS